MPEQAKHGGDEDAHARKEAAKRELEKQRKRLADEQKERIRKADEAARVERERRAAKKQADQDKRYGP